MAYDGLFTKKMVESLQSLVSGRIHKINQPENDTIIMVVRQNQKIINYYYQFTLAFQGYKLLIKI